MASVAIQKAGREEDVPPAIFQSVRDTLDEIERLAFGLFRQRGGEVGHELDDWFQAERELVWSPRSELAEEETGFRLRLAVPGLETKQIQITALPDSIVVQGQSTHQRKQEEGLIRFTELSNKKLFRRFVLPAEIDVDRVAANLDRGIFEIAAAKAAAPRRKKSAVAT